MLSPEIEHKLADLLFQILSGEKRVEESRFSLSRHRDFELSCAFKELDRIGMGSISSSDLKYFLEKNRVPCSSEEAYLIIRQYDINSDGRLSIPEFRNLVIPNTLPNSGDSRGNFSRLSLDAEFLLIKVLENELKLQRCLEILRKDLVALSDFNLMEGFRCLDKRNNAHIDEEALYIFLRRSGFSVCEMDMQHILNRIDRDRDGIISYLEFVDSVLPSEPHTREKSPSKNFRASSPLKTAGRAEYRNSPEREISVRNYSPLKASPHRASSPLRSSMLSSNRDNAQRVYSPTMTEVTRNANSLERSSGLYGGVDRSRNSSPLRGSVFSANSSLRMDNSGTQKRLADEREIIDCFREEIRISRELEELKNELSLKADFNLIDAFRMFDITDKGAVDLSSIEDFLNDFSLKIDRDQIYLLIRHYSHLQDNFLRFSDFTEIFTPSQEEYARLLRNRSAYNLAYSQRRRVFSRDTLALFLDVFKAMLNSEIESERMRQKLARISDFRVQEAFVAIDRDGDGFITVDELRRSLDESHVYPSVKDLKSLMQRYDKNKDGRVSLTEFIQEVTPKSPKKY